MFIENGHPKRTYDSGVALFNLHHFYKHAIPPTSVFLNLITGKTTSPHIPQIHAGFMISAKICGISGRCIFRKFKKRNRSKLTERFLKIIYSSIGTALL